MSRAVEVPQSHTMPSSNNDGPKASQYTSMAVCCRLPVVLITNLSTLPPANCSVHEQGDGQLQIPAQFGSICNVPGHSNTCFRMRLDVCVLVCADRPCLF